MPLNQDNAQIKGSKLLRLYRKYWLYKRES